MHNCDQKVTNFVFTLTQFIVEGASFINLELREAFYVPNYKCSSLKIIKSTRDTNTAVVFIYPLFLLVYYGCGPPTAVLQCQGNPCSR